MVVIVESVRVLVTHEGGGTNKFHLASILSVAAALGKSGHPQIIHRRNAILTLPLLNFYARRQTLPLHILLLVKKLVWPSPSSLGRP